MGSREFGMRDRQAREGEACVMTRRYKLLVIVVTLVAFVVGLIIAPDLHEAVRGLWR